MGADSLYTTMAGLQAINARMEATSSNIANVDTPGYAAIQAMTEAAPYVGANAPGGADAVALTPGPDTQAGPLNRTGNPLDVGLAGDAWLQVQTPNGNALTRDGTLQVTNAGILADSAGDPVLGVGGQPISVPTLAKLEIGSDGTVSGVPANSTSGQAQTYGQINLVATPAGAMTSLGGSLFAPPAGAAVQQTLTGSVHQGYLNGSNVDPTRSMMDLISDSRSYQMQTDLIKNQSSGDQGLNTLLAQG
jgi:flagellar basal-body rod protein FlgF